MKTIFMVLIAALLLTSNALSAGKKLVTNAGKTIEGTLVEYYCGDNCYLDIVDSKGKPLSGLCNAQFCNRWADKEALPAEDKGRRVRITVGRDFQYDDAGHKVQKMTSFKKIIFID